jgi:MFS family permease
VLGDRDYRRLFGSTAASQFGFHITLLALPLSAIIALDANELQAGLVFALMNAAFLLMGLPAGAWLDRMRRRSVLVAGDLARAVLLVSVPLAWWAGSLTLTHVYVVAFLFGVCTVFFDVAYQSYLPHLLGRRRLVEANARLESVRALAQVGAPGVGGQLVQILTAPVALLCNAVAMALSSLLIVGIRKPEPPLARSVSTRLLADIVEGLRFVLGSALLRPIAACTATANLFLSIYLAMLMFFLARDLALPAGQIGVILSVGGAGSVVGALSARRFAARVGQGPVIWLSAALGAPFALLMPLAQPGWRVWLGAAGLLVTFAGAVVYNVAQVSLRQAVTPDRLLGRMNATMRFLVWGTLPLGGVLGGLFGGWFGARTTLVIAALGATLAFLPVLLSPLRGMREVPDHLIPEPRSG